MTLSLKDVLQLLEVKGQQQYGMEAISQLEHALQCASLAEQAGECTETVAACLLHDLGHMLAAANKGAVEIDTQKDDLHQFMALPFLRDLFPDSVLEPIRMHVDAKRYLCLIDPKYWEGLSSASRHSLELQGGVFSAAEAERFIAQPYAAEAVRLRRYDDLAKVKDKVVPSLSHYVTQIESVVI